MGRIRMAARLALQATAKDLVIIDQLERLPRTKANINKGKRLFNRLTDKTQEILLEELEGEFPEFVAEMRA
jgi:hypothetical protein